MIKSNHLPNQLLMLPLGVKACKLYLEGIYEELKVKYQNLCCHNFFILRVLLRHAGQSPASNVH